MQALKLTTSAEPADSSSWARLPAIHMCSMSECRFKFYVHVCAGMLFVCRENEREGGRERDRERERKRYRVKERKTEKNEHSKMKKQKTRRRFGRASWKPFRSYFSRFRTWKPRFTPSKVGDVFRVFMLIISQLGITQQPHSL